MELIFIFFIAVIIIFIFSWITTPTRCDVCYTPFKRKYYTVKHDEKTAHLCPNCNRQYEKKSSKQMIDLFFTNNTPLKKTTVKLTGLPVTKFLKKIEQPRGGFIKKKDMIQEQIYDNNALYDSENIHPSLIGITVDYLTRYMLFGDKESSFKVSLIGASLVNETNKAKKLLENIDTLDSKTIRASLKLSGYDVIYRAGRSQYKGIDNIEPNEETIENITIMIKRAIIFFKKENVIDSGMTFEGAYTRNVSSGDADYLTEDTIWDMKVSKTEPNKDHTIQLIIYYLLMKKSIKYKDIQIKKIGIFNPRKNISYTYELKNLNADILKNIYNMINN